jgi:hypothetical protein
VGGGQVGSGDQGVNVLRRRLVGQRLAGSAGGPPGEVVSWLVAVQAQDPWAARWAVGIRLGAGAASATTVEAALADGSILRTHVMRWTWQFVSPADARWLLALVAPRLFQAATARHRELGLDATTFRRSRAAFERALGGGEHLTRAEMASALGRARQPSEGPALSHLLASAELAGVICSGAPREGKATYALLDLRAPGARPAMPRQEALAELARRYARSRGPVTAADFGWWAGLTLEDARSGLAAAGSALVSERVGGETFWHWGQAEPGERRLPPSTQLLPAFDEYLVSYKDRSAMLDTRHARRVNAGGGLLGPTIVVSGQVVGTWRRTLTKRTVEIALSPFERPTAPVVRSVEAAAARYARFLGLAPTLRWT